MHLLTGLFLFDEDEIPRLHIAHRRGLHGRCQNTADGFVGDGVRLEPAYVTTLADNPVNGVFFVLVKRLIHCVEWSVFKENMICPWNKYGEDRLEDVEDFITTPLRTDMNQTTADPIAKTDLEKGLLLDFASIKLDRLTLPIKQELDLVSYEEID